MSLLSCKEQEQAASFRSLDHRTYYSVAHINMRLLLSRYLQQSPDEIRYETDQLGKPRALLENDHHSIHFNLSHTGAYGMLAVSNGYDVGIDAELMRPIMREIATTCFSPYELRQLDGLRGHQWLEAFYRCWTCKEAVLKAEGVGLTIPLDSFDIEFTAGRRPSIIACRLSERLRIHWQLFALESPLEISASLAVSDTPTSLSIFQLSDWRL
jgi:4'-phosphopantetheinyl transferase